MIHNVPNHIKRGKQFFIHFSVEDLETHFSRFGEIKKCSISRQRKHGTIAFATEIACKNACNVKDHHVKRAVLQCFPVPIIDVPPESVKIQSNDEKNKEKQEHKQKKAEEREKKKAERALERSKIHNQQSKLESQALGEEVKEVAEKKPHCKTRLIVANLPFEITEGNLQKINNF